MMRIRTRVANKTHHTASDFFIEKSEKMAVTTPVFTIFIFAVAVVSISLIQLSGYSHNSFTIIKNHHNNIYICFKTR